jgi:hypothetical protein
VILHETARIGGRAIITVFLPAEHAQQRQLLATVMGGMGHTAGHHPGPRPADVEKRRLAFPPRLILLPQHDEAFPAVFLLLPHEFQPDFFFRQRWRSNVYIEHRSKPNVLADTLMHHMLMETTAPAICRGGAHREIMVREHAPGTDHFDALRLISVD